MPDKCEKAGWEMNAMSKNCNLASSCIRSEKINAKNQFLQKSHLMLNRNYFYICSTVFIVLCKCGDYVLTAWEQRADTD